MHKNREWRKSFNNERWTEWSRQEKTKTKTQTREEGEGGRKRSCQEGNWGFCRRGRAVPRHQRCITTHAGVPQQCLGWMNRRGAAPGATKRERRGEEKRFNRAKAMLSREQRHTEPGGWNGQRPLSFRRTSEWQVSMWPSQTKGSQGHDGQDRITKDRWGQQVGAAYRLIPLQNNRRSSTWGQTKIYFQ